MIVENTDSDDVIQHTANGVRIEKDGGIQIHSSREVCIITSFSGEDGK